MLDFISKDVREYMERNGLEFTDFEKAALIQNAGLPVLRRLELLEQLAEKTEDASLKENILARLASDRRDLELFRDNTEGYVYAVEALDDKEPYICGYFAAADLAYAHGMKQGCKFRIEKYLIVGFNGRDAKKAKGYFNPNLMGEADMEECVEEYDYRGLPEAGAQYDKDGTLEYFWSAELERSDEENISRSFDSTRFENVFIKVPNPFERGDIVRLTTDPEGHGIVQSSQLEWQEFLERVASGRAKWVDFSDASITVDFLQDNGHIGHDHISPVFLEKFEPQKGDMDYDVLMTASGVHQGKCTLDFFLYCLGEYRKQLVRQRPGGGVSAQNR